MKPLIFIVSLIVLTIVGNSIYQHSQESVDNSPKQEVVQYKNDETNEEIYERVYQLNIIAKEIDDKANERIFELGMKFFIISFVLLLGAPVALAGMVSSDIDDSHKLYCINCNILKCLFVIGFVCLFFTLFLSTLI